MHGLTVNAMEPEEKDPVWKLLGQMPPPKIREDFTQRVMASLAQEKQAASKIVAFPWYRRPSVLLVAACVALLAALAIFLQPRGQDAADLMADEDEAPAEMQEMVYWESALEEDGVEVDDLADEDIARLLFADS